MLHRRAWLRTLAVTAVLLSACTTTVPEIGEPDDGARPPPSIAWIAEGKLALSGPELAETASFKWQRHSPSHEQLRLSGPLGFGAVDIVRDGNTVYWLDGEQARPLSALGLAPGPEQLVMSLPMDHLGNWLLGEAPDADSGWQQQVQRWQSIPPWRLPRNQQLSRGDLQLRIFLSKWRNP